MKTQSLLFGLIIATIFFILFPLGMIFLTTQLSLPILLNIFTKILGTILFIGGIFLFLYCSKQFVSIGKGTPVPIEPPNKLVIDGLYKITRNPIYFSYFFIFFGMALYFGHLLLFIYAFLSIIGINIYVIRFEEPALNKRFGKSYQDYCRTTPRWLKLHLK